MGITMQFGTIWDHLGPFWSVGTRTGVSPSHWVYLSARYVPTGYFYVPRAHFSRNGGTLLWAHEEYCFTIRIHTPAASSEPLLHQSVLTGIAAGKEYELYWSSIRFRTLSTPWAMTREKPSILQDWTPHDCMAHIKLHTSGTGAVIRCSSLVMTGELFHPFRGSRSASFCCHNLKTINITNL